MENKSLHCLVITYLFSQTKLMIYSYCSNNYRVKYFLYDCDITKRNLDLVNGRINLRKNQPSASCSYYDYEPC